jgi:glycosyltransferase involved in cell wall biosynthesis
MGYGNLPRYERVEGVELHRVACRRRRKEMASPWEGLRWANRCIPLVRTLNAERPFDVVHAHFIMPAGIVAGRMQRATGVPVVITPHGSDVPGYNRERLKLAHVLVRPWWRRICRQADLIACPSTSLLKLIQDKTEDFRWQVIPNGFDPTQFERKVKQKHILLCSRLVERKGFQYFLQAIAPLTLPGWQVDIVGDGPMYARLADMAKRCRTPVHMHGWIDNDDRKLAELYGRATIFAFPSEWENCSIALLEAMSAGCAVVCADVGGNREVVGDCGYLIRARDVEALRQAVVKLTANPKRCQEMGRRAATRVTREFDWNVIARRYLGLFESLTIKKGDVACEYALSATKSPPGAKSADSEQTRAA